MSKLRRGVLKVASHTPLTKGYISRIKTQDDEIIGLKESVARLEARNDEWAAEVRALRHEDEMFHVLWPVFKEDIIAADYRFPPKNPPYKPHKPPYVINWVVPPVGSVSGGHSVIMELIRFLESQGHTCRIYFYDPLNQGSLEEVKKNMKILFMGKKMFVVHFRSVRNKCMNARGFGWELIENGAVLLVADEDTGECSF